MIRWLIGIVLFAVFLAAASYAFYEYHTLVLPLFLKGAGKSSLWIRKLVMKTGVSRFLKFLAVAFAPLAIRVLVRKKRALITRRLVARRRLFGRWWRHACWFEKVALHDGDRNIYVLLPVGRRVVMLMPLLVLITLFGVATGMAFELISFIPLLGVRIPIPRSLGLFFRRHVYARIAALVARTGIVYYFLKVCDLLVPDIMQVAYRRTMRWTARRMIRLRRRVEHTLPDTWIGGDPRRFDLRVNQES